MQNELRRDSLCVKTQELLKNLVEEELFVRVADQNMMVPLKRKA